MAQEVKCIQCGHVFGNIKNGVLTIGDKTFPFPSWPAPVETCPECGQQNLIY